MIEETTANNIEKAKQILIDYEKATELVAILDLYKRLSLYAVFLWENLATLKKAYNTSYYTRKIEVSKSYLNNKKEKITDRQSLELATSENEELFKQEWELESLAMRLDIFVKQVNRVIDAMRTDISFLKWELNRTKANDII